MKIICLTRDFCTEVDDDLYDILIAYSWYAQGPQGRPARRLRNSSKQLIYMYHQILNVNPAILRIEGKSVDHIDRNPLNNQKSNLRIVSHTENMLNSKRHLLRLGVGRDNTHDTWKAYIDRPYCNRINIGTFKTREAAEEAVNNWKLENE